MAIQTNHPSWKWQKTSFQYYLNDEELDSFSTQHHFESWPLRFGEHWSSGKTCHREVRDTVIISTGHVWVTNNDCDIVLISSERSGMKSERPILEMAWSESVYSSRRSKRTVLYDFSEASSHQKDQNYTITKPKTHIFSTHEMPRSTHHTWKVGCPWSSRQIF